MSKHLKLFIIGILILLLSVQNVMFKEMIYQWEMDQKYKITEINEMYAGAPTTYQFGTQSIETYHIPKGKPLYKDPWDNLIMIGDVFITLNGQKVESLEDFPVKLDEGLNQYQHYVSYWLIYDKKKKEKSFAIVLQTKRAIMKSMEGFIPNEEQNYRMILISKKGKVKTENFTYKTKSKLQTKLIPPMKQGAAGYYTDEWAAYPSIFTLIYPFLYPIGTFIIGMILTLLSLILFIKHRKKYVKS
jgi:hypothetical protein